MSFVINCYGLDGNGNANEAIESTDIYVYFIAQSYSVESGDTFSLGGFSDEVKFTANPADGYVFTRWVYRVGSATGTVKYSYDNPFTYDGTQDIYIRAEGKEESTEPDEPTWTLVTASVGTINEVFNDNFVAKEYRVYRYRVKFEESGTATFYTKGNTDTYGLLTTTTGFDEIDGFPTGDTLVEDDESGEGSNFKFSCKVEAGTNYYVWVRFCFGTDSGDIDFYIEPPGASSTPTIDKWSWTSSNGSATATQTKNAYNAVKNKLETTDFSYKVWNDMVDKVHDIIWESGRKFWDSSYATETNTKFSASPYELTAVMFNSLRNNIELVGISDYIGLSYKTGIDKVNSGDKVKGEYFLTLAEYMNDCIDNL